MRRNRFGRVWFKSRSEIRGLSLISTSGSLISWTAPRPQQRTAKFRKNFFRRSTTTWKHSEQRWIGLRVIGAGGNRSPRSAAKKRTVSPRGNEQQSVE